MVSLWETMNPFLLLTLSLVPFLVFNPSIKWTREKTVFCIDYVQSHQDSGDTHMACNHTKIYATGGALRIVNFLGSRLLNSNNLYSTGLEKFTFDRKWSVNKRCPADFPSNSLPYHIKNQEDMCIDEPLLNEKIDKQISNEENPVPESQFAHQTMDQAFSWAKTSSFPNKFANQIIQNVYQVMEDAFSWAKTSVQNIVENQKIKNAIGILNVDVLILNDQARIIFLRIISRYLTLLLIFMLCAKLILNCFNAYKRRQLFTWELFELSNLGETVNSSTKTEITVVEEKYKEFIAYNKWRDFGEVLRFNGRRTQSLTTDGVITVTESFSMCCIGIKADQEIPVKHFKMSFEKESKLDSFPWLCLRSRPFSICDTAHVSNLADVSDEVKIKDTTDIKEAVNVIVSNSQEEAPDEGKSCKSQENIAVEKSPVSESKTFSLPDLRVLREVTPRELCRDPKSSTYRIGHDGNFNITRNRIMQVTEINSSSVLKDWSKEISTSNNCNLKLKQNPNRQSSSPGFPSGSCVTEGDGFVGSSNHEFSRNLLFSLPDVRSHVNSNQRNLMTSRKSDRHKLSSAKPIRRKPVFNCVGFRPSSLLNNKQSKTRLRSSKRVIQ